MKRLTELAYRILLIGAVLVVCIAIGAGILMAISPTKVSGENERDSQQEFDVAGPVERMDPLTRESAPDSLAAAVAPMSAPVEHRPHVENTAESRELPQGPGRFEAVLADMIANTPPLNEDRQAQTDSADTRALAWIHDWAEQGDAWSQTILATWYHTGDGVAQDHAQAAYWFRKAAEQGDATAQYNLGLMYHYGHGVQLDLRKAVEWYRKAAEQGNARAQLQLGTCYEEFQYHSQAAHWYRKAAEQEDAWAQWRLGRCYEEGRGVAKDYAQAAHWYRKAAEQGDEGGQLFLALAYLNLGRAFRSGRGVIQDDVQACAHFLIAGALGIPSAAEDAARLRIEKLSPASYEAAQRQANAWMAAFRAGTVADSSAAGRTEGMAGQAEAGQRTGTGFVISPSGYFLSCAHVVQNSSNIRVHLAGRTYRAQMVRADTYNDVALLKLDGVGFHPLPISQVPPEMGARVFTVGFPNPDIQGASAKYTDGSISSLSGIMDDVRTMQISVPVQGGNSGGPLTDEHGNVIGIVIAQLDAATVFEYTGTIPQNVNFAVKMHYALPIIQAVPGLSQTLPQARTQRADSPVQAVEDATGLVVVYE